MLTIAFFSFFLSSTTTTNKKSAGTLCAGNYVKETGWPIQFNCVNAILFFIALFFFALMNDVNMNIALCRPTETETSNSTTNWCIPGGAAIEHEGTVLKGILMLFLVLSWYVCNLTLYFYYFLLTLSFVPFVFFPIQWPP